MSILMQTLLAIATTSSFNQNMHVKVQKTIEHAENVPGLNTGQFFELKDEIQNCWNELNSCGYIEKIGNDKEIRPHFVALQAVIEHVFANELNHEIETLNGVIHTPAPATPLCTEGEITPELVHTDIEIDPLRLFTVNSRTTTIRNFLQKGGNLSIIYPKNGINKRTEKQQEVYRNALLRYPNLFDCPIDCEEMESSLIGATYFLTNKQGQLFVFSIQFSQANNLQENGQFGLWFGEIENPIIQERVAKILDFIHQFRDNFNPINMPSNSTIK